MNMSQEIIAMIEADDFDTLEIAHIHRAVLKSRGLPYAGAEDQFATVVSSIQQGRMDEGLKIILGTVLARQAIISEQDHPKKGYSIDDTIRIKIDAALRPKYLLGKEFTVRRINRATVTVGPIPNEPAYGRFAGLRTLRIPIDCVESV